MENLFNGLYLNLLVPLVFPSVQNMSMQDLDDKILSGNICNASWYLCLLPALVKDCMLSYQLSCNQIANNRQDTVKAMRRISFWVPFYPLDYYEGKAYMVLRPCTSSGLGGCVFPLKGSLWSFQGSTLIKQIPYLPIDPQRTLSVL